MRLTIYKDVPVKIKVKETHIHKIGGIIHRDFCSTFGDIPIAEITDDNKVLPVDNPRGKAYAARKRQMYRKGYRRNYRKNYIEYSKED